MAVPWAVLFLLPYVSWSFPSVNRFGTTPSTNFFPVITCSSNMSATLTIASSSVTNVLPHLLHMRFYWMMASMENQPIILETEPDQEFLGFMLETQPLELIYQGPTQVSQVLSPFSASPPSVLLSGFRSRCHIVIKGAFPSLRVQQGLSQLIRLYARAGFPNEELQSISNQLLIQHQNSSSAAQKTCFCCLFQGVLFLFSCVSGVVLPSCLWFLPVPARVLWCPAVSCFSPSASWLNFRFLLASSSFERSWITLKGERSIIIWPEQLCILTIWQGSCLFSNRPLNMMNRRLRQISVLIIQ